MFERTKLPIVAIGLGAQAKELGADRRTDRRDAAMARRCRRACADQSAEYWSAGRIFPTAGRTKRGWRPRRRNGMPLELHQPRSVVADCARSAVSTSAPSSASRFPQACIIGRNSVGSSSLSPTSWNQTSGVYIAQSEIDMIRMARGEWDQIDPATFRTIRSYIRPDLSDDGFRLWCKRYATCFIDAASWIEAMRNFDFVVGPRFHGVMFAMQAGTPGGVVAHDSRTHEMCETMSVPVRMVQDMPAKFLPSDLPSLFQFDAEEYGRRRCELGCRYAELLVVAGIEPSDGLQGLRRHEPASPPRLERTERSDTMAPAL